MESILPADVVLEIRLFFDLPKSLLYFEQIISIRASKSALSYRHFGGDTRCALNSCDQRESNRARKTDGNREGEGETE